MYLQSIMLQMLHCYTFDVDVVRKKVNDTERTGGWC